MPATQWIQAKWGPTLDAHEPPPGRLILPGDEFAESVGFTTERFDGWLWLDGREVWVSFVIALAPGRGDFGRLIRALRAAGYEVKVPTPFRHMTAILKHLGFRKTVEPTADGPCEVWVA